MMERVNQWFEEKLPAVPLETQLENLARLGIALNDRVGVERLLAGFTRDELEESPYSMLFSALGGAYEDENGEWLPISDDILYLDSECIEESGIYSEILSRLNAMAKGALTIADAEDEIFPDENRAEVRFTCDGGPAALSLELIEKQIDTALFLALNEKLAAKGCEKAFRLHLGDRVAAAVFLDKKNAKQLERLSGVYFE